MASLWTCGTAMLHEGRIIIGCVGIARSKENIKNTKKATFMVRNPVSQDHWRQYEATGELPDQAGYRLYCSLIEETKEDTVMTGIRESLRDRVGERIAGKITSAMIFSVDEVRAIRF